MKTNVSLILAVCIISASAVEASAQDIIDHAPLRAQYDEVNWDKVSLPPSDPYTLSYIPARPDGALDITDKESCEKNGGKWPELMRYNNKNELVGCRINGVAEGRWTFVQKGSYNSKKIVISNDIITGYSWYVNGKEEGEIVQYNSPDENFIHHLIMYHDGKVDGTEMEWNEVGQLVYFNHYDNGEMHGDTALFSASGGPIYSGTYTHGKPADKWYLFHEMVGSLHYVKDYSVAVPEDIVNKLGAFERAVWTVEYDIMENTKRIEGFRLERIDSDPATEGTMLGHQTFYDSKGEKWLDVIFGRDGVLEDKTVIELCKGYEDFTFDHNGREIACIDKKEEVGRNIKYYSTGEIRAIDTRIGEENGHWTHEEFHKSGENLTRPAQFVYTVAAEEEGGMVPEGEVHFLANSEQVKAGKPLEFGSSVIVAGSGDWTEYWYNGNVRLKGSYLSGKKNGEWTYYDENGAMKERIHYLDGKRHGTHETWFGDGMPDQIKNYKLGKPDGYFRGYYTLGGLAWEAKYKDGTLIGHYKEFNGVGALQKDQNLETVKSENGSNGFPVRLYYSNGNLRGYGLDESISDTRNGRWKLYLLDGTYWRDVIYDYGNPVGPAPEICRDRGGEYVIDEEKREEGCYMPLVNREVLTHPDKLRSGVWKWWDEKGAVQRIGEYKLGHFDGKWSYYFPGGKPGVDADEQFLMLEGTFRLDRPVGEWKGYYTGHKTKFSGSYDSEGRETGVWTTYYENGQKSSSGLFVSGNREGNWQWWYDNGQLKDEGKFDKGRETGIWTSYYNNGAKSGEGEFKEGKREGHWTWWRENGEVWRETDYISGKDQSMK